MLGAKKGRLLLVAGEHRGFSMIELMIGLAIVGILIAVGFPAFIEYMQNNRVLAAAEGFNNLMQRARAEAVSRNATVQFILTSATTADTSSATASIAVDGGKNSLIRTPDLMNAGQFTVVDSKFLNEGASTVDVSNSDAVAVVAFNGLGSATFAPPLSGATIFQFKSSVLACAATSGASGVRCLSVRVAPGGQSRLCDPLITAPSDTRSC